MSMVPPFTSSTRDISTRPNLKITTAWTSNHRHEDAGGVALDATTTLDEEGGTMAKEDAMRSTPSETGLVGGGVDISIEYCSACRWMLRASWIAMELLTTFAKDDGLRSVTLLPTGGRGGVQDDTEGGSFRVLASSTGSSTDKDDPSSNKCKSSPSSLEGSEHSNVIGSATNNIVLWDRKIIGRFPESKEVKQLVRDFVNPTKDLGHSDVVREGGGGGGGGGVSIADVGNAVRESDDDDDEEEEKVAVVVNDCIECKEREANEKKEEEVQVHEYEEEVTSRRRPPQLTQQQSIIATPGSTSPSPLPSSISANLKRNCVTIEYSIGGGGSIDSPDNGLYRAAYYANELLTMVYERNAWWKMRRQRCLDDDVTGSSNGNDDMPIAVDSVTLAPNRFDRGLLVSFNNPELWTHSVLFFRAPCLGSHFYGCACIGQNKESEAE